MEIIHRRLIRYFKIFMIKYVYEKLFKSVSENKDWRILWILEHINRMIVEK